MTATNTFTFAAITATLLVMAAPASAQFSKPEDAVKYRQSTMSVMGTHFARVSAMANGRVPFDAKAAVNNADIVATMAKLPWAAFGPGTQQGGNSQAKPEIWTEQVKFKAYREQLVTETTRLAATAQGSSLESLKAAVGATAKSCKACHDAFEGH